MMELYATGWNAWNQLSFSTLDHADEEPDDIGVFTCVLSADAIRNLRPHLSYTTVETESGRHSTGLEPKEHIALRKTQETMYLTVVEALNDVVVVSDGTETIHQFPDMTSLLCDSSKRTTFQLPSWVEQVVAYDTGFAALTADGRVWTWGDERYDACLGREISKESPADRPGSVLGLEDLPTGIIRKIAAGGYTLAALTTGNDLYCWGGHPGKKPVLQDLTGEPMPIVIEDHDILDVGVGDSHLVALAESGDVYCIGDNKNGQLGLGLDRVSVSSWVQVPLNLGHKRRMVGVAAGSKNSFVIVQNDD